MIFYDLIKQNLKKQRKYLVTPLDFFFNLVGFYETGLIFNMFDAKLNDLSRSLFSDWNFQLSDWNSFTLTNDIYSCSIAKKRKQLPIGRAEYKVEKGVSTRKGFVIDSFFVGSFQYIFGFFCTKYSKYFCPNQWNNCENPKNATQNVLVTAQRMRVINFKNC